MFKESPERLRGNEAFEGFGVELIQGIAEFLSRSITPSQTLYYIFAFGRI